MSAVGSYSRVSRKMWNDEKFRKLSPAPACAQFLWLRLLTAPESTCIPGLFQAWEAGLAQSLGWSLKAFRKAFKEIEVLGLVKVDWAIGLVWVPKAIHHNTPTSPNIVKSWEDAWAELPECELKAEAWAYLQAFLNGKHASFADAFAEACTPPSGMPSGMPSASPLPIQKQEQDQKQDQEQEQKQDPPTPDERFSMHPGWQPSADTLASFDVALIPRWASEQLVARHRSHFVGKKSDRRTDEDWNQSCAKWVFGDWNDAKKRPKPPVSTEPSSGKVGVDEREFLEQHPEMA